MRRLITAVLAAAVLALTGCGSDQAGPGVVDDPHPTRTPEPTPPTEPSPPPAPSDSEPTPTTEPSEPDHEPPGPPPPSTEPAPSVDSVTMTQSGGFAGLRRTWDVGPSDPGHAAVFAAASPKALADAEGSKGKPPCCDLYQYRLTVSYSDGAVESFRIYDSARTDPALTRLVQAVLQTQPRTSDSPTLQ